MKLRKVDITNFRCFSELSIPLHKDVNVIVGVNGTGKTAILDAIAVGLAPILQRLSSAGQRLKSGGFRDTDFRVMSAAPSDRGAAELADYARVALETQEGVTWDNWRPSGQKGAEPPVRLGLSSLDDYIAAWQPSQGGRSSSAPMPVFAYYGPDRGLLNIPDRLHRSKTDFSYRTSALVGALDARSNFKECLQWFDAAEADELRVNRDRVNGEFEETTELYAVRRAIRTVFGNTVENPRFVAPSHKLVVNSIMPGGNGAQLRVDQLSHGYQAMLAMIIDFARRQALANPDYRSPDANDSLPSVLRESGPWSAPGIILIDEIDLHLHPSWQQRVIQDLRNAFPNTQIIVTTHSPQVLTTVHRESIRILRGQKVYSASAGTYGTESKRPLEEVMETPSRPPGNENTEAISHLFAKINAGQLDEADAICRGLMERMGVDEPALVEAQTIIENRRWEKELGL